MWCFILLLKKADDERKNAEAAAAKKADDERKKKDKKKAEDERKKKAEEGVRKKAEEGRKATAVCSGNHLEYETNYKLEEDKKYFAKDQLYFNQACPECKLIVQAPAMVCTGKYADKQWCKHIFHVACFKNKLPKNVDSCSRQASSRQRKQKTVSDDKQKTVSDDWRSADAYLCCDASYFFVIRNSTALFLCIVFDLYFPVYCITGNTL